jgi:hypothetical protein
VIAAGNPLLDPINVEPDGFKPYVVHGYVATQTDELVEQPSDRASPQCGLESELSSVPSQLLEVVLAKGPCLNIRVFRSGPQAHGRARVRVWIEKFESFSGQ